MAATAAASLAYLLLRRTKKVDPNANISTGQQHHPSAMRNRVPILKVYRAVALARTRQALNDSRVRAYAHARARAYLSTKTAAPSAAHTYTYPPTRPHF